MKKILLLFLACIFASSLVFSQTREYEDWYLLPSPFYEDCPYAGGVVSDFELDISKDPFSSGPFVEDIFLRYIHENTKPYTFLIIDKAQYYKTDEPIEIVGVAALFKNIGLGKMHGYLCITDDSLNVVRKVKLESYFDTIAGEVVAKDASDHYVELFFDSSISVNGDFYVMIDGPKPSSLSSNDYNWTEEIEPFSKYYLTCVYGGYCSGTKNFSLYKKTAFSEDENILSYYIDENNGKWIKQDNKTFYIFPILADTTIVDTTDSSSLVNIVDNYTFIFPNPTSKEVNVQCSFRMQALELFNEQGQKVNEWKIDSYHYLLNVEDYPKGNYILKIKTKSGTAIKKVIVQ
jgi:hypothetical protein